MSGNPCWTIDTNPAKNAIPMVDLYFGLFFNFRFSEIHVLWKNAAKNTHIITSKRKNKKCQFISHELSQNNIVFR